MKQNNILNICNLHLKFKFTLQDGLLNRLAVQGQVVESNFIYLLILGNFRWQTLAWPLKLVDGDARMLPWVLATLLCQGANGCNAL